MFAPISRLMPRSWIITLLALLGVAVPVAIVVLVGDQHFMMASQVHFGLVGSAAAIASLASLALSIAGHGLATDARC